MKHRHIPFIARLILILAPLAAVWGCSDDDEARYLRFDLEQEGQVTIGPEAGSTNFVLRSNTSWKIETRGNWFSFNITEGAGGASVIINYDKNEQEGMRSVVVTATTGGGETDSFTLLQMPDRPVISLEPTDMQVPSEEGTYTAVLTTNIEYPLIDISVVYAEEESSGWIPAPSLSAGELQFRVAANTEPDNRTAVIVLSHMDDYGRNAEAYLTVRQMFSLDPDHAVARTLDEVKQMDNGPINGNMYIEGKIVGGDKLNTNFQEGRYVIQDGDNRGLVLEYSSDPGFDLYDDVRVWLAGAELEDYSAEGYSYKALRGIGDMNILDRQPGTAPAPKVLTLAELDERYVYSLVTVRDVEVGIPVGTWVNYNQWYTVTSIASYREFVHNEPQLIHNSDGEYMYVLTNIDADWAYTAPLPKGTGNITGILVYEENVNHGELGQFKIRPRTLADIDMSDTETFTETLAEWSCDRPSGDLSLLSSVPSTAGQSSATLHKSNSDIIGTAWEAGGGIYFIQDYRAGATVSNGTINSANWDTDVSYYVTNISTIGISGGLRLFIQANSQGSSGPRHFTVETSLDGQSWHPVPDGDYTVQGQIESTFMNDSAMYWSYNPGYKCYAFTLPDGLLGQPNIWVRMRNSSTESVNDVSTSTGNPVVQSNATSRLAHVLIKYNK